MRIRDERNAARMLNAVKDRNAIILGVLEVPKLQHLWTVKTSSHRTAGYGPVRPVVWEATGALYRPAPIPMSGYLFLATLGRSVVCASP